MVIWEKEMATLNELKDGEYRKKRERKEIRVSSKVQVITEVCDSLLLSFGKQNYLKRLRTR